MSNVTIQEEYSLPSKGQIYSVKFDPCVKLRSMTVADEMKRLTSTDSPYKNMSEIIESCLETKLPVSVYDMCLGDYQYLLHKLRVVTYGPDYKLSIICPYCGEVFDYDINLDELEVYEFDDTVKPITTFKLPVTGKTIEIGFQTPRDLDNIDKKKKKLKKEFPDLKEDPSLMLNLESMIKTIDGQPVNPITIETFIKKLPMKDSSLILQKAEELNSKVGIDIHINAECPTCGYDINTMFRFTTEFFRPRVD
ncbi:MAG: hypothetical protein IJH65_03295 [Methanobrevibacter sp.]|nr:hypothetical protein [Methanobrevibacter sp.]